MTIKLKCDGCGMMASRVDEASEPVCPTCGGTMEAQAQPATIEITRQMKPETLLAQLERCASDIDDAPPTKPRAALGSLLAPPAPEPEAFTLLHLEEAAEQARREHASSLPPPPAAPPPASAELGPVDQWADDAVSAREPAGRGRWFDPRIAIPALVIGVSLGALMGRLNADPVAAVTSLRHRVVQHAR